MNEEIEREKQEISLPIDWHLPSDIKSRYATNVIVQAGQREFFISFFEIQPPILTSSPEENKAYLEQLQSVKAECVGKIIVAAESLPEIITALQTTLKVYLASKTVDDREGE